MKIYNSEILLNKMEIKIFLNFKIFLVLLYNFLI